MTVKCKNCYKKFRDNYGLERHKQKLKPCVKPETDDDEIDVKCKYCKKIYTSISVLYRHQRDNCIVFKQLKIDQTYNFEKTTKIKKKIVDKVTKKINKQLRKLKKENEELKKENEELSKENKKIKKINKKLMQDIDKIQNEISFDTLSTCTNDEELDYDPSEHKDILDKFNDKKKKCGYVYIVTSEDKLKKCLFKIGFTTNKLSRIKSFKTADPDLEIVAKYKTSDIQYTEKIIHKFLDNARYKGEFFYVSSLEICKNIVKDFCEFSDNCLKKYSNDYKQLRNYYIKNKEALK